MNNPVLPIFVIDEDLDVSVSASVEDAELDLEAIDVKAGGLVAYDAEGRQLRLEAKGSQVTISLAEDKPNHATELEAALRNFLRASHDPAGDDPTCDLKCLVNACGKFASSPQIGKLLEVAWRKTVNTFRN